MFNIRPVPGRIAFVDTEFTTLDKLDRELWEGAVIVRDPGQPDVEYEWQVRPYLNSASPDSLRIGRYYQRCRVADQEPGYGVAIVGPDLPELGPDDDLHAGKRVDGRKVSAAEIAVTLARMLDGAYLVGKVVSADELTLERFLRRWGQCLTNHYRIRCVETMAHSYLLGRVAEMCRQGRGEEAAALAEQIPPPPWDPKILDRLVGVEPLAEGQAHRALADARYARDVWDAIHRVPAIHRSTETSD